MDIKNEYSILALVIIVAIVISMTPTSAIAGIAAGADLKATLAKYDPAPAEKGKMLTVWIKVENTGGERAENAVFTMEPLYPFSLLDENDAVNDYGSIPALSDVLLEYKLIVDENAPKGVSNIKFKYTFGQGNAVYEKMFNITVKDSPTNADLKVLYVETKPAAYPGADVTLTVDVINAAPGKANYIIAEADSDIATIERSDIFIGTLEADDFDSVDIKMKIDEDVQPGAYPVDISLSYKDENYNEQVVEEQVIVTVVSQKEALATQQSAGLATTAIYLIILIIVIRAVGFRFVKWFFRPVVKSWRKNNNMITPVEPDETEKEEPDESMI